jgi:hypothetical protein
LWRDHSAREISKNEFFRSAAFGFFLPTQEYNEVGMRAIPARPEI